VANYWYVAGILLPALLGGVTSVWFTIAAIATCEFSFTRLRTMVRNVLDDGRVIDHQTWMRWRPRKGLSNQGQSVADKAAYGCRERFPPRPPHARCSPGFDCLFTRLTPSEKAWIT